MSTTHDTQRPSSPVGTSRDEQRSSPVGTMTHYTAGLSLFLFAVMVLTGMLLSAYYVPSTDPALSTDGRALGIAIAVRPIDFQGVHYVTGETIALPLSVNADSLDVSRSIRDAITPVVDSTSGRIVLASAAWMSVDETISRRVELGRAIRSIHHYTASLFIASLVLLLALGVMRDDRLRRPAQSWMMLVGILVLALVAAYTGSLLPWNRLALTAARIGSAVLGESLPFIGHGLSVLAFGGTDVSQSSLTRAHALHVTIVPMIMTLLIALLYRNVRRDPERVASRRGSKHYEVLAFTISVALLIVSGIACGTLTTDSPYAAFGFVLFPASIAALLARLVASQEVDANAVPASTERSQSMIYRHAIACVIAFGIIATIAMTAPWNVAGDAGLPADLNAMAPTPANAHPEWYLMFAYGAVSALPTSIALLCVVLVFLLLAVMPIAGRDAHREGQSGNRARVIGLIALALVVVLTALGYLAS
ncbi:MAG: cytochrome b N-terminal domain-containing protein [bacterium]|nr:cytochrome b N-terminal domain-containing protein [Candidatus Kapabacteria bacterium]